MALLILHKPDCLVNSVYFPMYSERELLNFDKLDPLLRSCDNNRTVRYMYLALVHSCPNNRSLLIECLANQSMRWGFQRCILYIAYTQSHRPGEAIAIFLQQMCRSVLHGTSCLACAEPGQRLLVGESRASY